MSSSKIVVVGAGLAGTATAWRLAERGHEVTVLERDVPASARGSSHGSARIFRYAYPDPFYARLVRDARRDWDELEAAAGQQLLQPTGSLDFGALREVPLLADVLGNAGVPGEVVAREDAARRWPQIRFDTDVLWHAAAGVLDAQSAVLAMTDLVRRAGGQVLSGWPVAGVERSHTGVVVTGQDGRRLDAERVVIAAGAWLPGLLRGLSLPPSLVSAFPPLQVMQENAFHFPYREGALPQDWPTFIQKTAQIQVYGLPGGRDAGFSGQKVAEYNGGRPLTDASVQTGRVDPANRDRVIAYVRENLPGLVPEPYAETTCLFTNTPDQDFVLDGDERVTVVSACSGHGAKFAPLIGRLVADVVAGTGSAPGRFRLAA